MDKKVLIVCETGISAALFVSKFMEKARDMNANWLVDYSPIHRLEKKLTQEDYEAIVLSPQVVRHEEKVRQLIEQYSHPCKILWISEEDFAYMNIDHVYEEVRRFKCDR